MKRRQFDLKAQTLGERWFERAVNYSLGLWYPLFAFLLGVTFTVIYYLSPSSHASFMVHFGPLWMMLALVHFERYHARKAIERLLDEESVHSEDEVASAVREAEQAEAGNQNPAP